VPGNPIEHRAVPQNVTTNCFYSYIQRIFGDLSVHSGRVPGKLSEPSGLNLVHHTFSHRRASTIDHPQAADFT